MPVRIGVQIQPQHSTFAQMQQAWRDAEELGVDSIYTWDHFYPLYGEPDGAHHEGVASLTALAATTERVRVGALVFCNSYRNPQLLANVHTTIDQIAAGRAVLGIGAGWFERDYDEYGYEFGTAPERLRALGRDLPLIKDRLAKLNPQAVGSMPIMIGGAGEKVTLRLVAEHADMWHAFGDTETYLAKSEILTGHCAKVGRDPNEIERVWGAQSDIDKYAQGLADAGVGEITIGLGGSPDGYDLGPLRELIQWREHYNGA